jgi:septal ring-binding cell division protein DamX
MSKQANEERMGFASSVFLVAAVASVMVAGIFLKSEALHKAPPAVVAASSESVLPLGTTITPELPPPELPPQDLPPEDLPSQDLPPEDLPPQDLPSSEPVEAPPAAEPERAPDVDPVVVRLVARAQDDCARLAKSRGRWTAQLLVACKPETVDRLLVNAGGAAGLYVLPAQVRDEPCFRVCFGTYATPKEAAVASDLPKALRGKEKIGAVEIGKVLP